MKRQLLLLLLTCCLGLFAFSQGIVSLLTEIVTCNRSRTESFIWNILHGKNFLYIAMGPYPEMADNETTIDPYFCTMSRCEN